ncbi:MAG: LTA synthase family protein [Defluviitaleaceae bacterium]|nr:LTA synthase family protein [Defluviitaleaceae bacterium]
MKKLVTRICLIRLKLWQALVFLLVMSLALTMFLFLLQPLPIWDVLIAMGRSFGLNLFLNWLPLFLLMLLLYFLGCGATSSATIVGAVGIGLGFANRTKILLRNDPLVPWDLMLGGEVVGIARSFGIGAIVAVIFGVILYIVVAIFAAFVIRSEKIGSEWRMLGVAVCLLTMFFVNQPLYANTNINNHLHIRGNIWHQVNQFNSRGFVYSFIHAFNTNRVMRPEGYDRDAVLEKIAAADLSGISRLEGKEHPHILMIMGEAFSDLSMNPHFCFEGFTDPLENWQRLLPKGISGDIIVSVLGGGTAQTEFDVLTGLNARQFPGAPFAFRMITTEFESMAWLLNSLGYRSEFMHPGFDWFYNRRNVYRHLGFDRLMFIDEFDDIPTKGMYINEHDTINRVIEMFAEHRQNFPGVPYFNFTVTIQNHGPYVDKYLIDGPVTEANFSTDLDLLEVDINALSNFFHGLQDADIEFARLVDYVNTLPEPTVMVYFSDHLPAFNMRIYDTVFSAANTFEEMTQLYTVPFLILFNYAALEFYGISHPIELATDPYENMLFSSPFLGAYVMELLGFTNLSPFWDFNTELRREFPIILETRSFAPCLTPSSHKTREQRLPLYLYRDWSYFRIFDGGTF